MEGSGDPLAESFINDLMKKADDVADAGNGCILAGLEAMGVILFQPYQPALSSGGGGGSSSKMGWGDDDKYKKRHSVYRSRGRSGSWWH